VISFFLFSLGLFSWLVAADPGEFPLKELLVFLVAALVILAVQLALLVFGLKIFSRFSTDRFSSRHSTQAIESIVVTTLLSILTLSNSFFFLLSATSLDRIEKILAGLCLASLFAASTRINPLRHFVTTFSVVIILVAGTQVWSVTRQDRDQRDLFTPLSAISLPQHTHRPNIYFLFFDALAGPSGLNKLLDISDPAHFEILEASDFRIYDSISPHWKSIESFSLMLSNSDKPPQSKSLAKQIIAGFSPSYSFDTLKLNGYKTQIIFNENYLIGNRRGVDFAFPPPSTRPGLCDFASPRFFYFLCGAHLIWESLDRSLGINVGDDREFFSDQDFEHHVLGRLKTAATSDKPWFTLTYTRPPSPCRLVGEEGGL